MIKHKAYPKVRVAFVLSDGFSAFNVAGAMRVFEAVKTATGSNSIDVDFSAISGESAISSCGMRSTCRFPLKQVLSAHRIRERPDFVFFCFGKISKNCEVSEAREVLLT